MSPVRSTKDKSIAGMKFTIKVYVLEKNFKKTVLRLKTTFVT